MGIPMSLFASEMRKKAAMAKGLSKDFLPKAGALCVGAEKKAIQWVHAVDTGTMVNSVTMQSTAKQVLIAPTVDYAVYVALGTSRMAARPFHEMAVKTAKPKIMALAKTMVKEKLEL